MDESAVPKGLENISEKDRRQIEQVAEMLGPDPAGMGVIKNVFWGNYREDLVFPYPTEPAEERERCDELLARLDDYLRHEHPAIEIDATQRIPDWAISRLFELGVMGMIVPQEYGGGGFGITSYNRALELIGRSCGSTAVMVSAHQSIGCGALVLFGTEEQKRRWLPEMATTTLSAFCLSEPDVGSDAAGQRTACRLSDDGTEYILNGEKKWATSGALAGLFTVMAKQRLADPATGKEREGITALICTPDMEGIEVTSRNRSKCGIRGTWQARLRFTDVRVPRSNLLGAEGKGLNIALSCLNVGRCTLSAGMVGPARRAFEQALKWAAHRFQFDRPLSDFELIREKLARMAAYVHAMDAMLYMTTAMLDRGDPDIMVETAACKVFCSEMGFRTIDQAMQVMGGEGYMTENLLERAWRDSRINIIVEGANEVMESFIFAYGAKQLGELLLKIKSEPLRYIEAAAGLALGVFGGLRRPVPRLARLHPDLQHLGARLAEHVQELSHRVKVAFVENREQLVTRQVVQARIAWAAVWIHAEACSLSRLDANVRAGLAPELLDGERKVVEHLCALADEEIGACFHALHDNADATMRVAADAALRHGERIPNRDYAIPESTPVPGARGSGMGVDQDYIEQFGQGFVPFRAGPGRRPPEPPPADGARPLVG